MFKFIRYIWKFISYLRIALLNILFIAIIAAIFVSLASEQPEPIAEGSPLLIAPSGILVDKKSYEATPLELLSGQGNQEVETEVRELVKVIKHATTDDRIPAIILKLDGMYGGGLSKIEEVAQALETFKQSGKPVIAYGTSYSQQQYYLASNADTLYLHNMGNLFLTGFGMYKNYMKDATDKLAIKFNVFRVGEYKDAIENFTRNDMSEESREHNSRWINELWNRYTNRIENARSLEEGTIKQFIISISEPDDVFKGDNAKRALEAGLVDKVVSMIELENELVEQFGKAENGSYKYVGFKRYLHDISIPTLPGNTDSPIGLIVAQGGIVDGHAGENSIGSASLVKLLKQAQQDHDLKALIIRVNSGGGSAFASELIREKIAHLQTSGIPVYISMGSAAASGGYWISAPAEEIWATPTTITGSIGVWGLIPNFADSMAKLGIYSDGISTTELADMMRPERAMSEPAKNVFQHGVENIYAQFITLVAEAREQTPEAIHEIAQGKVWTGTKAKELGLVDNLGTLEDLIAHIKAKHSLPESASVIEIEKELSTQEQLMRSIMQEASALSNVVEAQLLDKHSALAKANQLLEGLSPLNSSYSLSVNKNIQGPVVLAECLECAFAQ